MAKSKRPKKGEPGYTKPKSYAPLTIIGAANAGFLVTTGQGIVGNLVAIKDKTAYTDKPGSTTGTLYGYATKKGLFIENVVRYSKSNLGLSEPDGVPMEIVGSVAFFPVTKPLLKWLKLLPHINKQLHKVGWKWA